MKVNRDFLIQVRVTYKEKKQLKNAAKKCHLTLSEYLRKVGLNAPVSDFPTEDYREIITQLKDLKDSIYSEDRDYLEWKAGGICDLMKRLYAQRVVKKTLGNNENLGD